MEVLICPLRVDEKGVYTKEKRFLVEFFLKYKEDLQKVVENPKAVFISRQTPFDPVNTKVPQQLKNLCEEFNFGFGTYRLERGLPKELPTIFFCTRTDYNDLLSLKPRNDRFINILERDRETSDIMSGYFRFAEKRERQREPERKRERKQEHRIGPEEEL